MYVTVYSRYYNETRHKQFMFPITFSPPFSIDDVLVAQLEKMEGGIVV